MKIEIYVPDYELDVVMKIMDLKERRKLSGYVVELLRKECEMKITEERIIELIKQYGGERKESRNEEDLKASIGSVLGGLL